MMTVIVVMMIVIIMNAKFTDDEGGDRIDDRDEDESVGNGGFGDCDVEGDNDGECDNGDSKNIEKAESDDDNDTCNDTKRDGEVNHKYDDNDSVDAFFPHCVAK